MPRENNHDGRHDAPGHEVSGASGASAESDESGPSRSNRLDQPPQPKRQKHHHVHGPEPERSTADYTVGWICALHTELAAAQALLDDTHHGLPPCPGDGNTYTLGRMGRHNVVMACLPSGQYGCNNAAKVASDMCCSFPCIRVRLMVGIGGGAPAMVDVRLGDVVVSDGVVQHDFGKMVDNGRFDRTGTVRIPPPSLMTAVAKLRALHESGPGTVPAMVAAMIARNPSLGRYAHCGVEQDRLFDAAYDHASSEASCHDCDPSRLVPRSARDSTDPRIHYGRVASGNSVIKHGTTRDRISGELNVMCFEMEAAGLMDSFPCLVVRGICDYSDSHKNKQWQQYAAATAAAYTKELLSVIPADEGTRTLPTTAPLDRHDDHQLLIESLKFDQIDVRRSNIKSSYSTTCRWLLEHSDYLDWVDADKARDHHGFLWIKGKPGTGKSTLMNFAYTQAAKNKSNAVISFFFNARGHDLERSTTGMYRSLLYQLLHALPGLSDVLDAPENGHQLRDLHAAIATQSQQPEWPTSLLQSLLRIAISRLGQQCLTVFVDALDECGADQVEEMVEYFERLGQCAVTGGKRLLICFSSRHYPHIDIQYGRKLSLERQEGHDRDIATYIHSKLRIGRSKTAEEIKAAMQAKAGGIFMWIVLVVEILNVEFRGGRIFNVRGRLDALPTGLSELFREILLRDQDNLQDLRLCAQWVLFAKRPLKLPEYYFAVVAGLSPDDLCEWDPDDVTTDDMSRFVLSSSKGLAETTRARNPTVQFIHESVREFFLKEGLRELWPGLAASDFESTSHRQLQQCCSAYIKLDFWGHLPPVKERSSLSDLRLPASAKFPFLQYATDHVLHHADAATGPHDTFLREFPLGIWIRLHNMFEKHKIRRYTESASLLYIFAERNLPRLIETRVRQDPMIHIKGERYHYPFFAALANNHPDAVRALLQQDAGLARADDVSLQLDYGRAFNSRGAQEPLHWALEKGHEALAENLTRRHDFNPGMMANRNRTPLSWAAEHGHEGIVRLLLATEGVDADAKDKSGLTPLSWAAKNGHQAVTKSLLATKGVDVSTKDRDDKTPLVWATESGHEGIVRLLLATEGVDINTKDRDGRTPLSWAAEGGHKATAELLLVTGRANADSKDKQGRTPLWWAVKRGHTTVVELLLATGQVNADLKDAQGRTPLSWAIMRGDRTVVELLLATDRVNADSEDAQGRTLLSWAASEGHATVVELLLATGRVNADSKDAQGRTPLSWAAMWGHTTVVELLLATGRVNADSKDRLGSTPLSLTCRKPFDTDQMYDTSAAARLLLESGQVDANSRDEYGQTPLLIAARKGDNCNVRLLLDSGQVDASLTDTLGQTALRWAAMNGRENVVKLLLDSGQVDAQLEGKNFQELLCCTAEHGYTGITEMLQDRAGGHVNTN